MYFKIFSLVETSQQSNSAQVNMCKSFARQIKATIWMGFFFFKLWHLLVAFIKSRCVSAILWDISTHLEPRLWTAISISLSSIFALNTLQQMTSLVNTQQLCADSRSQKWWMRKRSNNHRTRSRHFTVVSHHEQSVISGEHTIPSRMPFSLF